jgi:hypothetical protein
MGMRSCASAGAEHRASDPMRGPPKYHHKPTSRRRAVPAAPSRAPRAAAPNTLGRSVILSVSTDSLQARKWNLPAVRSGRASGCVPFTFESPAPSLVSHIDGNTPLGRHAFRRTSARAISRPEKVSSQPFAAAHQGSVPVIQEFLHRPRDSRRPIQWVGAARIGGDVSATVLNSRCRPVLALRTARDASDSREKDDEVKSAPGAGKSTPCPGNAGGGEGASGSTQRRDSPHGPPPAASLGRGAHHGKRDVVATTRRVGPSIAGSSPAAMNAIESVPSRSRSRMK